MAKLGSNHNRRCSLIYIALRLAAKTPRMRRVRPAITALDSNRRLWSDPVEERDILRSVALDLASVVEPKLQVNWNRSQAGLNDAELERRTALVLDILRISGNPHLLPLLEAEIYDRDDPFDRSFDVRLAEKILQRVAIKFLNTVDPLAMDAVEAAPRGEFEPLSSLEGPAIRKDRSNLLLKYKISKTIMNDLLKRTDPDDALRTGSIKLGNWRVIAYLPLCSTLPHHATTLIALASPDGTFSFIATDGSTIQTWNLQRVRALAKELELELDAAETFLRTVAKSMKK
jgi:hypothetical protein